MHPTFLASGDQKPWLLRSHRFTWLPSRVSARSSATLPPAPGILWLRARNGPDPATSQPIQTWRLSVRIAIATDPPVVIVHGNEQHIGPPGRVRRISQRRNRDSQRCHANSWDASWEFSVVDSGITRGHPRRYHSGHIPKVFPSTVVSRSPVVTPLSRRASGRRLCRLPKSTLRL